MNSILIIDDEIQICESIKMILEYEGYNVLYSTDAPSGLKKISQEKFSALLLDIQMPEMSGFEALKKIKSTIADKQQYSHLITVIIYYFVFL